MTSNTEEIKIRIIRRKLWISTLFVALIILLIATSCSETMNDPGDEAPVFLSALVNDEARNKVIAQFSDDLFTGTEGFTIEADDNEITIAGVEGSGTPTIGFELERELIFDEVVSISYNASEGNASGSTGINLSSFSPRPVANNITQSELSVLIANLPPEAQDYGVWLVLRTTQDANTWEWAYGDATVNLKLSQTPDADLFDIVIYATDDIEWRPNQAFSNGYYCTLLNQDNKYQNLKIISWINASTISGVNMGIMDNESASVVNIDLENAYDLRTDGLDYFEGDVINTGYELWYKFATTGGADYQIIVRDSNSDEDFYTGKVQATVCDNYGFAIPAYENAPAIANYPLTYPGDGSLTYIKIEAWEQVPKTGTFNVYVLKQ